MAGGQQGCGTWIHYITKAIPHTVYQIQVKLEICSLLFTDVLPCVIVVDTFFITAVCCFNEILRKTVDSEYIIISNMHIN